jgi:hypothetical protein
MQAQSKVKESQEKAGSFFDNLFGGGSKADKGLESSKAGAPPAAPAAKTAATPSPKPAAPAAQKEVGSRGIADKRAAAVATALKNLGAATGKAAVDGTAYGGKESSKEASKVAAAGPSSVWLPPSPFNDTAHLLARKL